MKSLRYIGIFAMLLVAGQMAKAQQINLDRPTHAGALTLFPGVQDENTYYYLPNKPRLGAAENGTPQFSFLRYVTNVESGATEDEVSTGEGGGILHAVVELGVTQQQLQEARQALRRINSSATIEGPVMYRTGTVAIVSSFADENGDLTQKIVGLGNAPLLDGDKAAVSIRLTKLGSKILWESFQTPTPDMSFSFEMEIAGFRAPKRALIEANFDMIYEHQSFEAAAVTPVLAGEIKTAYDDLMRSGAIKVTTVGADEQMEALISTAYNKLTQMMFEPAGGSGTPDLSQLAAGAATGQSMLDRATSMLKTARDEVRAENERIRKQNERNRALANQFNRVSRRDTTKPATDKNGRYIPVERISHEEALALEAQAAKQRERELQEIPEEPLPSLAVAVSYQLKKVRHRGNFTIDLNKWTADNVTLRFDENFGSVDCEECFRQINTDDPLYRQREIVAFVDGLNAQDFGNYINFVSVLMRKRHEGGDVTDREVRIDRNNFNREGNNFKLVYGWKNDTDRTRWLNYEYKTIWSFFGGYAVENDWQTSRAGAINLAPPFQRRQIDLEADPDLIADAGVRSINVNVFYHLGDEERVVQAALNPRKEEFSRSLEIIQPNNVFDYEYEISWRLTGNQRASSGRKSTNETILFVDEIPSE